MIQSMKQPRSSQLSSYLVTSLWSRTTGITSSISSSSSRMNIRRNSSTGTNTIVTLNRWNDCTRRIIMTSYRDTMIHYRYPRSLLVPIVSSAYRTTTTINNNNNNKHHNDSEYNFYNPYRRIGQYLYIVSGMVIGMISIGGITRLTQSGLSMTSWTLTGSIPPLTLEQWEKEFHIYQQYPEYQQRKSMTLADFQYIYFWEYGHRMMGRLIGIVYVLPYLYFTITKQIPKGYHPRFLLIGSIGLLQGYVGWWMVQSGLTKDRFQDTHEIRVKPLRLATHLCMAITTYSLLLYTALDMYRLPLILNHTAISAGAAIVTMQPSPPLDHHQQQFLKDILRTMFLKDILRTLSRSSIGMITLTFITILSGALVAGNDAGRAYNTFPKMNDEWFPSDYFGERSSTTNRREDNNDDKDDQVATTTSALSTNNLTSIFKNFYENTATVQFNHRLCGITTAISGLSLSLYGLYRINPSLLSSFTIGSTTSGNTLMKVNPSAMTIPSMLLPYVRTGLMAIGIAVTGQFTLGVTTLLTHVPIPLAALHQIGSLVVLTSSIYLFHTTRTILKALPTVTKTMISTPSTTSAVAATTSANSALTNPILLRQVSTISEPIYKLPR